MISKHTKILLLIAVVFIGIGSSWQHYSQSKYEKSDGSPTLYNLDTRTGVLQTNKPDHVPRLAGALTIVGVFALLLGLPLLVSDITHRRPCRLGN